MTFFRTICSLVLLSFAAPGAVRADWPQWRGPQRDGRFSGPEWPGDFTGLKKAWSVPLGPSYSGPVTGDGMVFTTESVDKRLERVHAYDMASGEKRWTAEWEGYQGVPFFAAKNGDWMRSTPAWDGKRLYVAGMRDVLVCLEGKTGKEVWRVDFVKETGAPAPAFGCVCSPLLDGDFLYVQAGAAVCKLEKASGKIVWRSAEDGGGMWGSAFSSPVLANIGGQRQLLVQSREALCGLTPDKGEVLWTQKIKAFRGMNIFTPVVQGNRLFTSAYQGLSQAWDVGRPGSKESPFAVSLAWEDKAEGYMSTPVVIGGKVFMHLRNKKVTCLDLATGERHWTSEAKFGEYWSLISQGGRILALDERGILYLLKADPEKFTLLAEQKVSDSDTWAHVAMDGRTVFIREGNALSAWVWK